MELPNSLSACHQLILEQNALISELTSRIDKLAGQLSKNSKNSNKPPSSEGLNKKPAFPRKSGGKLGGVKGHQGKTLEMVLTPDVELSLLPLQCSCGADLDKQSADLIERRQVFDLPEPKLQVTEYRKLVCKCQSCGKINSGEFPSEVAWRVQYGSGVRSLTTLLNCGYAVPIKKIQQLFLDLYGYKINEATIKNNNQRCSDLLQPVEELIKDKLVASVLGHSDETGIRVAGKLYWLHVFSNQFYTYLFVHPQRGKQALQSDSSLLTDYSGWVVHDCWKSYFGFEGCKHALCGAHLLRELTALEEKGSAWAVWFKHYLMALLDLSQQNQGVLTPEQQGNALILFQQLSAAADEIEPKPINKTGIRGRPKATIGRNLLNRLVNNKEAVLAFAFHKEVPFTNNLAERDLRPAKTKQKVSGCFRTIQGADQQARIYGFISTIRKQHGNVFNEIKKIFQLQTFSFKMQGN